MPQLPHAKNHQAWQMASIDVVIAVACRDSHLWRWTREVGRFVQVPPGREEVNRAWPDACQG